MTEPFWGGHPHFTQFGLDRLFSQMLDRVGDGADLIQVFFDGPGRPRMSLLREPDFTPPADIPPGHVWLPNIERRRATVTMDEADPDGTLRSAVQALVDAMPYRDIGGRWPYGSPSLELRRCGATMQMPYGSGRLAIYTEGREKTLAPDKPFWMSFVSVHLDQRHISDSDILMAGGIEPYVLATLIDDEHVDTPVELVPLPNQRVKLGLMSVNLPLDTFVRNREN